jgi:hypothetical protein
MNPSISSEAQIRATFIANLSHPALPTSVLNQTISQILLLYPDDPALGSPFNTGNETFGLSPEFKRAAAIGGFNSCSTRSLALQLLW